ncbi:MAG: DUF1292 domain-containing protein [Erysipelotrichaceae bacterium]|nr:DUF1292 domain-containing protein [Erysipelotrichaceae bacterium]
MAVGKKPDNRIIITLDDGTEKEMVILLTFNDKTNNKDYVLYYDHNDESGSVFAFQYDKEGKLKPLTTKKEWDLVQEVFDAYMSEEQ